MTSSYMLCKCYLESCCYMFLKLTVRSSSISINHSEVMSEPHTCETGSQCWVVSVYLRACLLPCCITIALHTVCGCACVHEELMMGAHGRTLSNHSVAFTLCRVHAVGGKGGSDCFDTLIAGVREEFEWGGFDSSASDPDTVASLLPAQLGSDARPAWGDTLLLCCSEWKGPL